MKTKNVKTKRTFMGSHNQDDDCPAYDDEHYGINDDIAHMCIKDINDVIQTSDGICYSRESLRSWYNFRRNEEPGELWNEPVGARKKPVWETKPPKGSKHHHMTPAEERRAKNIAKKHGTKVGLADRLAAMNHSSKK
jgi:hypothetical protein